MKPKVIAVSKSSERKLWVLGEGRDALAVISASEPKPEEFTRPLIAVLAHLDPREWREV